MSHRLSIRGVARMLTSREVWRADAVYTYWRAEAIRLRALWWLEDMTLRSLANWSLRRLAAGRRVPHWWSALLVLLLTGEGDSHD